MKKPTKADDKHYAQFKVKEYDHWSVFIHHNQCYLGRTYVRAHRKELLSLEQASTQEREELFAILRTLQEMYDTKFSADHINFSALGNVIYHCHMHVIPRYRTPQTFAGMEFVDEN